MNFDVVPFKLSDAFLDRYKTIRPKWGIEGEFTYYRTYSRRVEGENRNETWWETIRRVIEGTFTIQKQHCASFKLPWNNEKAQRSAQIMFDKMFNFKFLPPGRGLWMMGTEFVAKRGSAALMNCFSGDTKIFTDKGLIPFKDIAGTEVMVLDGNKTFVSARVRSFGRQKLYSYAFKPTSSKSLYRINIEATKNHTWILSNGERTTNLKLGDEILSEVSEYPNDTSYKEGFAHGFIFGDGSRHTYYPDRHYVRLCGKKEKYRELLESVDGYVSTVFGNSKSESIITIVRKGEDWKSVPVGKSYAYMSAFVAGWLAADGSINAKTGTVTLDSIDREALAWVADNGAILGWNVVGLSMEHTMKTNFGIRVFPLYRLKLSKKTTRYKVISIEDTERVETVYCATVPSTHSFFINGGLLTGNCAFVSTEDIRVRGSFAFTWAMDALMLGVGVGFDTKGAGKIIIKTPKPDGLILISDDREGWVESVRSVIDAFFYGKPMPTFDYSLIRPYGTPIKGFGGVASGPQPLIDLHKALTELLTGYEGRALDSTGIADIMNYIGVCVVAGNVRRSAEACIGEWDDEAYINLKNPTLHGGKNIEHRWVSNNSIFAYVGKTDYHKIAELIARNGEPGIVWLENIRTFGRTGDAPDYKDSKASGLNPCFEQILESGECCCLVETFPSLHESFEEYNETLKYAYMYAKTVNLLPTEWPETNAIMLKNRRIGTSMSGIIDAFVKHGRREVMDWAEKGYAYLKHIDKVYSDWLCVPMSIRVTSVKPSGTVSLLPGVSPGVHYHHSEYYIRRIRIATESPLTAIMRKAGYEIELTAYGKTDEEKKLTSVISFPVHIENFDRKKADVTIWEQVKNAVDLQRKWADNSVSITVTFKQDEAKDIAKVLEAYEDSLKAISFLPLTEHGYVQAPYEEINKERYDHMMNKLLLPRFDELYLAPEGEAFCDGDSCQIPKRR